MVFNKRRQEYNTIPTYTYSIVLKDKDVTNNKNNICGYTKNMV